MAGPDPMQLSPLQLSLEEWGRHAAWLERLARRLVQDPQAADDLVQETWLAALSRPGWTGSARGWLLGVLRNVWRARRRSEGRRDRREREVASARSHVPDGGSLDTLAKAEAARELFEAVLHLSPSLKEAILLRYYDGLSPARIAEQLGVPVRTVHSRLARGLERLRVRYGPRHRALGLLAGLRWLPEGGAAAALPSSAAAVSLTTPLTTIALLMKLKVALPVLVVLGLGWVVIRQGAVPSTPGRVATPSNPSMQGTSAKATVPAVPTPRDASANEVARTTLGDAEPARASGPPAPPAATETIAGRVLDTRGHGAAGVRVAFRSSATTRATTADELAATADADGRFVLPRPAGNGHFEALDPEWITLAKAWFHPATTLAPQLVVAPFRSLAGHVVDEHGDPLPGARVRLVPPRDFETRFAGVLDSSRFASWTTGTDDEGHFSLEDAAQIDGDEVEVLLNGFEVARVPAPSHDDLHLRITLRRDSAGSFLTGRVLAPEGGPVPGCYVALGRRTTVTDALGEFRIERSDEAALSLRAVHPGYLPARLDAAVDPVDGGPLWPADVILTLGSEPLTLAGRFVDETGRPWSRLDVWIDDPTPFGVLGEDVEACVENLLLLTAEEREDGELDEASWRSFGTDAEGRFTIGGLLDREYRLGVLERNAGLRRTFGPFRPGAGGEPLEIVLERAPTQDVLGRVVAADGKPLAEMSVRLLVPMRGGVHEGPPRVRTDGEGRFRFRGVAAEAFQLWVTGEGVLPLLAGFARPADPTEELVVEVLSRVHFKVEATATSERADSFTLLDAEGRVLELSRVSVGGTTVSKRGRLVAGRSKNLGVSDAARWLVLHAEDDEVERIEVALVRGELNLLYP